MKKIGCFFGTFDPIHNGHLKLVDFFVNKTDIDEVWIIISPLNPFKSKSLTTKEDRFKMAEVSLINKKNIRISKIEFLMTKPNYTINTLNELSTKNPENNFLVPNINSRSQKLKTSNETMSDTSISVTPFIAYLHFHIMIGKVKL